MPGADKKDILYILSTVALFIVIGLYLAFTQGQSLSNVVLIPFRTNSITPTTEGQSVEEIEESNDEGDDYFAVLETNIGVLELDLLEKNAPNSVENFVYLSESKYYDGTSFHRFIPDLILQGGSRNTLTPDKSDDKFGNPGYTINDEINWDSLELSDDQRNDLEKDGFKNNTDVTSVPLDKYTIAWANSEADSNGSQFFIILGERGDEKVRKLEGRHTVFAKVVKGQELLDEISKFEVDLSILEEPRPTKDITINTIKIEKR
jgi:peptidyl-prolyl cis-trans isomerase B (cyclophilin B)